MTKQYKACNVNVIGELDKMFLESFYSQSLIKQCYSCLNISYQMCNTVRTQLLVDMPYNTIAMLLQRAIHFYVCFILIQKLKTYAWQYLNQTVFFIFTYLKINTMINFQHTYEMNILKYDLHYSTAYSFRVLDT